MCQNCEIVLIHSRYIRQSTLIHPCCHSYYFPTILFFGLLPTIISYNFVLWIIVNHFIHTILCVGLLLTISFILFFRSVVNHSRNFRGGSVGQPFTCAHHVRGSFRTESYSHYIIILRGLTEPCPLWSYCATSWAYKLPIIQLI